MKYKALKSFCGVVSMAMDEIREMPDSSDVRDLLKAGLIMEFKPEEKTKPKKKKGDKS